MTDPTQHRRLVVGISGASGVIDGMRAPDLFGLDVAIPRWS
jgi:3-polyprenyl-4-hydroxybenzoate decarboxylase